MHGENHQIFLVHTAAYTYVAAKISPKVKKTQTF